VNTQSNQGKGKKPDEDRYGGYTGYQPPKPADDPYGAYYQPSDSQGPTVDADSQQSDPNYVYGQKQQQGQSYRSSNASSGQQQQQQYEPPSSVSGRRYGSSGKSSTGLKPNQAAALSYVGICFTGLFFLFWGRKNRLIRFSAAQSVVLFVPLLIVYSILQFIIGLIAHIWIIGGLLAFFLNAAVLVLVVVPGVILWLFLILQAYRGVEVKLPFVGEYAERLSRLFASRQEKGKY
jgi:uncharacterized membrane protein